MPVNRETPLFNVVRGWPTNQALRSSEYIKDGDLLFKGVFVKYEVYAGEVVVVKATSPDVTGGESRIPIGMVIEGNDTFSSQMTGKAVVLWQNYMVVLSNVDDPHGRYKPFATGKTWTANTPVVCIEGIIYPYSEYVGRQPVGMVINGGVNPNTITLHVPSGIHRLI